MIVCWRTVDVPLAQRQRFLDWIAENRQLREEHGILFELVLERSARQRPPKTLQPRGQAPATRDELVVVTAWRSHDAFDAWMETPDRERLTASDVHGSVRYHPLTRYAVIGGYLNANGLTAAASSPKEEP